MRHIFYETFLDEEGVASFVFLLFLEPENHWHEIPFENSHVCFAGPFPLRQQRKCP